MSKDVGVRKNIGTGKGVCMITDIREDIGRSVGPSVGVGVSIGELV